MAEFQLWPWDVRQLLSNFLGSTTDQANVVPTVQEFCLQQWVAILLSIKYYFLFMNAECLMNALLYSIQHVFSNWVLGFPLWAAILLLLAYYLCTMYIVLLITLPAHSNTAEHNSLMFIYFKLASFMWVVLSHPHVKLSLKCRILRSNSNVINCKIMKLLLICCLPVIHI